MDEAEDNAGLMRPLNRNIKFSRLLAHQNKAPRPIRTNRQDQYVCFGGLYRPTVSVSWAVGIQTIVTHNLSLEVIVKMPDIATKIQKCTNLAHWLQNHFLPRSPISCRPPSSDDEASGGMHRWSSASSKMIEQGRTSMFSTYGILFIRYKY